MISEPTILVECDKCSCAMDVPADYVYTSTSGKFGYYDFSDDAINKKIERVKWVVDEDAHYCEDCADEMKVANK